MQPCAVASCSREASRRGWCWMHYHRWKVHGDPAIALQIRGDHEARFLSKTKPGPDGCIDWTSPLDEKGYGTFWDGTSMVKAHRWAWEHEHGPMPEGLEPDHTCRRRLCVFVGHLEAVTHLVNMQRGYPATKTECIRGHSYSEHGYRNSQGRRVCRLCDVIRAANRRARYEKGAGKQ